MIKSDKVRINCQITKIVDKIVRKNPLYGSRRKFIELAIIEKINRVKK